MKCLPLINPHAEIVREATGCMGAKVLRFEQTDQIDKMMFVGGPMDGVRSIIPHWMAQVNREITIINAVTKKAEVYSHCYMFNGIRYYILNALLGG